MQQMPMYSPGYPIHPQLGFHQYQQTGFHQHQQGRYPFDVHEDEDDDEDETQVEPDVEEVPETQVEQMPISTSKGKSKKFEKRSKPIPWTVDQEVALAKAWITVSEDSFTGNAKKNGICLR